MIIQLAKFMSGNEYEETITGTIDMDQVKLKDISYSINKKEEFPIYLIKEGKNEVSISFHAEVSIGMPCDRCLEEVDTPIAVDIQEEINFDQVEDATEDEMPYLKEMELDVDMLIFEELVPRIPLKVLCKEDCKGLCPVCGTNLNKQECGCDRTVADPRMAAIQDIFENFKEV